MICSHMQPCHIQRRRRLSSLSTHPPPLLLLPTPNHRAHASLASLSRTCAAWQPIHLPCPCVPFVASQGARFAGKCIKDLRSLGSDGWFYPQHAAENTSLREIIHDGFLHPKDAK